MKYVYEIQKEKEMLVPGMLFANDEIYKNVLEDKTIDQIKNVAKLPGIVEKSVALPDCHQGYGFCIGGVAAFDIKKGVISPGGVGYDINCGVRLLKTNVKKKDLEKVKRQVAESLKVKIPSGVGRGSPFQLSKRQLHEVLKNGAKWVVEKGYGKKEDYENIEEGGCMEGANPEKVSERAKKRGIGQLGTIGAGNHFVDVLSVEKVFDEKTAKIFGLEKNQIVILIHCGSRGLGHQVASDYIQLMEEEYKDSLTKDKELACAPIDSKLGQDYLSAMKAAANFAFANKQILTHWLREDLKKFFPKIEIDVVYEVCHNIAKIEEHIINGKKKKLCVHRKGATRSLGKGEKDVPEIYKNVGQPVLVPGSMGTPSYVLVGNVNSSKLSFSSSVHGAGRLMSRMNAKRTISGNKTKTDLLKKGTLVMSESEKLISEESPEVYKNVDDIVKIMEELKISSRVAKLRPEIVIIA